MAIGKVGTYLTDAPLQKNYIGDAMAQVEDSGFKYREEQRLKDKAKKDAKEKQDAELETDLGKIKSDTTKFSTQNALIIDAMTKLKNGVGQKAQEMNSGKISRLDYNIYKSNAEAQIGLIDQAAKRINAQATAYAKDVAEQKIPSGFEENALNFGDAYDKNNIRLELNPDGTMTSIVYDDTDPNNIKILDKGDLSKIGQNAFTPVYKYDLDKDKQEFIKAHPKVLNEQFVGNTKVGTKGISPEIEKAMDLKIEATVKDRNALAIKAKEITGSANPNITDPDIIEKVREKLKTEYMGMYSKEKTVDEAVQRSAENRQKKKDEVLKSVFRNDAPLRNDVSGVSILADNMHPNFVGFEEGKITFKNLGGEKGSGMGYVTSAGLEKDGHIVITAKALKTKGITFKVPKEDGGFKIISYDEAINSTDPVVQAELYKYNVADNYSDITKIYSVDTPELNAIALKAGFKGVGELKAKLKAENKISISEKKSKPKVDY